MGRIELRVPQDRQGRFSTEVFERYQRSEKALVSSIIEMYVQGVSTRKVKKVAEQLCGYRFSASTVSRLNRKLDGNNWPASVAAACTRTIRISLSMPVMSGCVKTE